MKLSIIMPCYNMADTVGRALDSVLMQDVSFDYEILIVDDASTDNLDEALSPYLARELPITVIRNERNSGNAHSFYRGLCAASGEYFCVLDCDDYYTIPDKLEKQIRFLDSDPAGEYTATATYFVVDFGNGRVHVPDRQNIKEFNYSDLITFHSGYYHTSTYVYRNIYKGNVPLDFDLELYRGDSPRTILQLMYSGKKVRVLDFVGSAYSYTYKGIWSSQNEVSHFQRQVYFYSNHMDRLKTEPERQWAQKQIDLAANRLENISDSELHHYPDCTIEEALEEAKFYANRFAFSQLNYMLREIFTSEYIDTLCATLGFIARTHDHSLKQSDTNQNAIGIFISTLSPHGGGVSSEIMDLIQMHSDQKVSIFITNREPVSDHAKMLIKKYPNASIEEYPQGCEEPFTWLSHRVASIAPHKIFYYCSHAEVLAQAIADKSACENICLFSFDHGFVTGLHNPNIERIAAKRPVDYHLIRKHFGTRVDYIPAWTPEAHARVTNQYVPFKEHQNLITASGAARFYKIDGSIPCSYFDLVANMLASTKGIHYHLGPIPSDQLDVLNSKLRSHGIPERNFIVVEWADSIPEFLLEKHIDLFIEPFPVVSYKMTLEVLAAGVPVIAYRGLKRLSTTDFIPQEMPLWNTPNVFLSIIEELDKGKLSELSDSAWRYFDATHTYARAKARILDNEEINVPRVPYYADDSIHPIDEHLRILSIDRISIMHRIIEKQQAVERQQQLEIAAEIARQTRIAAASNVRKSRSFRIGYIMLIVPRKLKRIITHPTNKELNSSVDKLFQLDSEQFVNQYQERTDAELCVIRNSKTYKIGRIATAPARGLKRLMRR